MKTLLALLLSLMFIGCASIQNGKDFQAGRNALLTGKTEVALSYFQSVADKDPTYSYGTTYRQGVLGFLGRTQYTIGQLPQAQKTLERALTLDRNDNSARLYLGLALARSDERQRGATEIADSMKGIHDYLEWVTQAHRFSFGQFWDPTRQIRSAIENDLAMIRSNEINWPQIIANGDWLGKAIDEESDRARDDEQREWHRNDSSDGGSSTR
jgi:tetratricopeptide (TPR) repeat protein